MQNPSEKKFATLAIHAGESRDPSTNAHSTPIYQTANFSFETAEEMARAIAEPFDSFFYSRTRNPTTAALENKLAVLEGMDKTIVTASGMAAVSIATMIAAQAGDHVLVGADLFIISRMFFENDCKAMGIEVSFVDTRDMDEVRRAVRPNTKAIFLESVSNPRIYLADLTAFRTLADENGLLIIVDNTFMSPYLLRPVDYGTDIVLHSATKYISGHGDTIAGVIAGNDATMKKALLKLDSYGQCVSPINAWLVLRGVRTLPLRMRQHSANALELAQFLESCRKVEWVYYPGLGSHPQHALACEQFKDGFGGMLAFKVNGGLEEMNRFANAVAMCDVGVSLGDVYTLVYPKPKDGNLVRVSVGCEDIGDIIEDFDQALASV